MVRFCMIKAWCPHYIRAAFVYTIVVFPIKIRIQQDLFLKSMLSRARRKSDTIKAIGGIYYARSESVPIHLKLTLSIKEASEYSNIGINKIDAMLKQPNCPFVLYVGSKKLVKRKEFEAYISSKLII